LRTRVLRAAEIAPIIFEDDGGIAMAHVKSGDDHGCPGQYPAL
jgi:hypothetical protein